MILHQILQERYLVHRTISASLPSLRKETAHERLHSVEQRRLASQDHDQVDAGVHDCVDQFEDLASCCEDARCGFVCWVAEIRKLLVEDEGQLMEGLSQPARSASDPHTCRRHADIRIVKAVENELLVSDEVCPG